MAPLPKNVVIAAGTYDGVLAGWERKENETLSLTFATAVHGGSVRSLSIASSPQGDQAGSLLSCSYDETLRTHEWHKRLTSSGEVRTPSDFGTPVCSSFAPPVGNPTHCILGFSNGKIAIYKKRDWSVQHVLAGHDGGVESLSVHPTGKLALSGGSSDGKLKLWDLTKGRLSFVNKITPASTANGRTKYDPVTSIVWSTGGEFYAFSSGPHITVRDVASGKDLLDINLPSRVNEITLLSGPEGLFVAAACNDGSLPVLAVEDTDEESRRAIMAIEPVDALIAREERFKCISRVHGYHVVTANSAGVVSLMNLEGAIMMIMGDESGDEENGESDNDNSDDESKVEDDEEMELAVDIIESTQLGTGARITCLTAWASDDLLQTADEEIDEAPVVDENEEVVESPRKEKDVDGNKRKREDSGIDLDEAALEKARSLVSKAKKLKKKKEKKKSKKA
jgi:protein MAK11